MLCGIIISSYRGCGWFFPQKQISNFLKFLLKFLLKKSAPISKRIVLAILLAALFLPVFGISYQPKTAAAQARGPAACTITSNMVTFTHAIDRTSVKYDETFNVQVVMAFNAGFEEVIDACRQNEGKYDFMIYLSPNSFPTDSWEPGKLMDARFYSQPSGSGTEYGFAAREPMTIQQLRTEVPITEQMINSGFDLNHRLFIYIWDSSANNYVNIFYPANGIPINYKHTAVNEQPTPLPALPGGVNPNPGGTPQGSKTVNFQNVGISIKPNINGKGLRSKYRVTLSDGDLNFGTTPGLDGIHMEWKDSASELKSGDRFTLPKKDDTYWWDGDPYYVGTNVFFNYASTVQALANDKLACKGTYTGTDCSGVIWRESDSSNKGRGSDPGSVTLPADLSPVLRTAAWKGPGSGINTSLAGGDGKPIGTVEFVALPSIYGYRLPITGIISVDIIRRLVINDSITLVTGGKTNLQPFKVEVYANIDDLKTACKAEEQAANKDPAQCDNEAYARFAFADPISQTTSSNEQGAGTTPAALFEFLRKVIAYIVLLLTSFIYFIFSAILVPVIIALIGIHPYRDEFVNFIYPGWVIIRNISNIFFIIALLWVGLRTIFQLEDSSKSRSFIIRLILMALLVNFSLVIGQAIVGIADTVQAQFLPENSKVVEALGHKLMVDPIVTFRGGSDGYTDVSGNITTEALASDLPKAIVLLVLAVAAFFAFVALIAFMVVRLVALWLLYMVSPLAYVGGLLPPTKSMAEKWWPEFIKYAFAVPIMAFFLNITALMAVTIAPTTGQSVATGNSGQVLGGLLNTGDIASEYVSFAVTTLSHFVVLVFLFAGMQFALKFGGYGAKQIVGAAQNGFKKAFEYPWRGAKYAGGWAKDTAADSLAESKLAKNKPWLQTAIRSAARPTEALKAAKKGYFDLPKERMNKSFTDTFNDNLTKKLQPWGDNKLFPVKMAAWKLGWKGGDAPKLFNQAEDLRRQAGIYLDDEKQEQLNQRQDFLNNRTDTEQSLELLRSGRISTSAGEGYVNEMDTRLTDGLNEINSLVAERDEAEANADGLKVQRLDNIIAAKRRDQSALQYHRDRVGRVVAGALSAGTNTIDIGPITADLAPVVDLDALENELQTKIDKANEAMTSIDLKLNEDDRLKRNLGISQMTPDMRADLMKQSEELIKEAQRRQWPASKGLDAEEAKKVMEKKKEIVDQGLDYQQIEDGVFSALKKNNMIEARAYLKVAAENGDMDKILAAAGGRLGGNQQFNYNIEGLSDFIKNAVKGTDRTQISVIREISNASEKSGNAALSFAVKGFEGGGGRIRTINEQMGEVAKKVPKIGVTKWKKGDVVYFNPATGKEELVSGVVDSLKKINNPEKARQMLRDVDQGLAKTIYDMLGEKDKTSIGKTAANGLRKTAGII